MLSFRIGADAVVELPFWNDDGDPVTPTGLSYRVLDSTGAETVAATTIADLSGTETIITVPSAVLTAPGAYQIELSISVSAQTYIQEAIFTVTPVTRLEILKNTFQSRLNAVYLGTMIPNLTYWIGAEREDQEVALIEAFRRITLLNFYIPWPDAIDVMNRIAPAYQSHITPRMWPLMTSEIWATYPEYFRQAVLNAQVVEANAVLTVDPMKSRREGGLFSEKIGESSIMFKSGVRPLSDGLSRDAMSILSQFIANRITVTRS